MGRSIKKSIKTSMSVKILVLSIGLAAIFGLVQSDAIKCWSGEVADGKTNAEGVEILKEKDCTEGITMCKNYTGTAKTTFDCKDAKCNTYSSAPMTILTPTVLLFTLFVSGLSF